MAQKICLNMIVKDAARTIERCLKSVLPLIDCWLIVDTGSTDNTRQMVLDLLGHLPGNLIERPWVDFGHNRTEALELARPTADYLFIIDADEELIIPDGWQRPELSHDAYILGIDYSGTHYDRTCLISTALEWRYVGVLHEYLEADRETRQAKITGPVVRVYPPALTPEQVREKYLEHARLLEVAVSKDPANARNAFYLAQSYRDAGELHKALASYQKRSQMSGWDEEAWYSLLEAAKLSERLGYGEADVIQAYLRAFDKRPSRSEPLVELARYCRANQLYSLGRMFAAMAMGIPYPIDRLFVDASVYGWRAQDEFAVSSYWCGEYRDCAGACHKLLQNGHIPASERNRIETNLRFALQKLA